MKKIHRDIVSALIFSKDGKLFQGMKDPAKGGVYADYWHIPGGGIEASEDKISALIREINEEVGIDITPYSITLVDDKGEGESEKTIKETGEHVLCKMKFYVYKVVINDKDANEIEAQLNDDLVSHCWSNLSDLKNMKITPPSVALFKRLGYLK